MAKMYKIDNRKDILLLLLFSPTEQDNYNKPITGRTRLVKLLFLFKMEIFKQFRKDLELDIDEFYDFVSWDYGPFSKDIYDDLTFFILNGFIESSSNTNETLPESAAEWEEWFSSIGIDESEEINIYYDEQFKLTDKGYKYTQNIWETLSTNQKNILIDFKKKLGDAQLRAILNYVYNNYSQYTDKSKIKDKVL